MSYEGRDYNFMSEAFNLAKFAYSQGQLPIGAILVINDKKLE